MEVIRGQELTLVTVDEVLAQICQGIFWEQQSWAIFHYFNPFMTRKYVLDFTNFMNISIKQKRNL